MNINRLVLLDFAIMVLTLFFSRLYRNVMVGKKLGFGKFARSIETQQQYIKRKNSDRIRGQLLGASNRFPKYPSQDYTPENRLYGLQNLGKSKEMRKIKSLEGAR